VSPQKAPGPIDPLTAESLAAAIEVGELLVVVLDRDARILYFNAACERMTGYRADELLGRSVWELIPEEQHESVGAVHESLQTTGSTSYHENEWLTRDGRRRLIAWSNAALRDESGAIVRGLGTGIDVTELRSSQREQREAELRLAAIVHSAMDAIVTLDEDQCIAVFNAAAEEMFGHSRDDVLGKSHLVLLPERFRGAHGEQLQRFAKAGETSRRMGELGHVVGLRANGEEFPAEASISRTQANGKTLLTAIFRDISEQVRAVEASALLESVVQSSDDAILATDREGRILSWNPAAEEVYGYSPAQAGALALRELAAPEHADEIETLLERALLGKSVAHLETVGLRRGGVRVEISLGVAPRRDGSGSVVGASWIARDISQRKELERRLRRSEEMASLGTLIAGLAHDIGTPMNVILGYIGMLERSLTEDRDRERVQIVRGQIERVVHLVQTLMNFARPGTEKPAEYRVDQLLERALDLIPEMARRRGISIELDFGETGAIRVQGERIQRAFLNLFVNACDAMADGGGTLRVSTEPLEEGVRVRIADTGHGVPPEALPRIFEPFFTTKEAGQGSGLGLFVTRGIILEQGGEIRASSEPGGGSAFCIDLPREPLEPDRSEATQG